MKLIKQFHTHLYGLKFVLRTDHSALQWLLNFESPEGQVARWIRQLQEYDFLIQHCEGTSHHNADRLPQRLCNQECKQWQCIEKNVVHLWKLMLTQPTEWR